MHCLSLESMARSPDIALEPIPILLYLRRGGSSILWEDRVNTKGKEGAIYFLVMVELISLTSR